MQIAGVSVLNRLTERLTPPRIAAIALVVLLHIVLLFLLFHAVLVSAPVTQTNERQITIWLKPPAAQPKPQAQQPPRKAPVVPIPDLDEILKKLRSITLPETPSESGAGRPAPFNGIRALGEYLYNCSAGNYDKLNSAQWLQCIGGYLPRRPGAIGLGVQADSLWKRQRDEAKKPGTPFESACPQGSLNSNLGTPCHNFSGSALGISGPVQPSQ